MYSPIRYITYFCFGRDNKNCNDIGNIGSSKCHRDDTGPPFGQLCHLKDNKQRVENWLLTCIKIKKIFNIFRNE